MSFILITEAGGTDSSAFGVEAEVVNVAQGVFAEGATSGGIGSMVRVTPASLYNDVHFDLLADVTAPPARGVHHFFWGTLLFAPVGLHSNEFGSTTAQLAAQSFTPAGIDSLRISSPVCRDPTVNGGDVSFDLVDPLESRNPGEVLFHWGAVVISGGVGRDSSEFGTPFVIPGLGCAPAGIDSGAVSKPLFVFHSPNTAYVNFDLTVPSANPALPPQDFYWGLERLAVNVSVGCSESIGTPGAVNVAQGASAQGIAPPGLGIGFVYRPVANAYVYKGRNTPVSFDFTGELQTPNALNVPFYFFNAGLLEPTGINSLAVGSHTTYTFHQFVSLVGIDYLGIGQPAVANQQQYLVVDNRDQYTRFTEFGTPTIANLAKQYAYPGGIPGPTWGGDTFVAHAIRTVTQMYAYAGPLTGEPLVALNPRYIGVPWTSFTQFGTPLLGRHVDIFPQGFCDSAFGEPDVEGVAVRPSGWDSALVVGAARISRSPQVVYITQREQHVLFGTTYAYNSRQYIGQLFDPTYLETQHGTPYIWNGNRTIVSVGWTDSAFPITGFVENTGRAVLAAGLHSQDMPSPTVTNFVRYISFPGIDATWVNPYTAVYNNARVIAPAGFADIHVGTPESVISNLRFVRPYDGNRLELGTPVLGHGIRYVGQAWPSGPIVPPAPVVALRTNYIAPTSIAPPPMAGWINVLGPFFKYIAPSTGKCDSVFAYPTVRNVTPQIYPPGRPYTEFGFQTRLEFLNRSVQATSVGTMIFGRASVVHRNRTIYLSSANTLAIPVSHNVRNELPDPPSTRIIIVGEYPQDIDYMGQPTIGRNSAFPDGILSQRFGTPWVRVQGCVTIQDWDETQDKWGIPSLNNTQTVTVVNADESAQFGWARLSPHTVWATPDTPLQAVANHPGQSFHFVDTYRVGSYDVIFGVAEVAHKQRTIQVTGQDQSSFATYPPYAPASVVLGTQYVFADGLKSNKYGYPVLLPHDGYLYVEGFTETGFGEPSVVNEEFSTHTVNPAGIDSLVFGTEAVELLNRPIYPEGYVATQWGDNEPMVHFPRHLYAEGIDATDYGDAWASFRVRTILPEGWDSFTEGYESYTFRDRLKVTQRSYLTPAGIDSHTPGATSVRNSRHIITPYMIAAPRMCPFGTTVTT